MIKLISGAMGSGKTKKLVEYANEVAATAKGNLIFIDDDTRQMYELTRNIRFVCIKDFPIENGDEFMGFICGMTSSDYDLEYIFIDGICKVMDCKTVSVEAVVERLKAIADRFDINIIATISSEQLPEELKQYEM